LFKGGVLPKERLEKKKQGDLSCGLEKVKGVGIERGLKKGRNSRKFFSKTLRPSLFFPEDTRPREECEVREKPAAGGT